MSPVILPVALKEPNQEAGFFGSPLRVTRIGLPVRFTLASRARQVALNLEIGTSSSTACLLLWSRSEEHTSELQSRLHLVCRLLLEKKKKTFSIVLYSD